MPLPASLRRLPKIALLTFVLGFAAFWLTGVLLTDVLVFHPPEPGYTLAAPYQSFETADGTRIVYRIWENPDSDRLLIYSHGNAEDIGNLDWVMPFYRGLGYDVVAYDYPGYGHSTGKATVASVEQSLLQVIRHLSDTRKVPVEHITLFGKSVGSGPAVHAATQLPVNGLILESAFTSVFQVPLPYLSLPLDSFPNRKRIQHVTCPVLVIHGTGDSVIPPAHATRLHAAAPEPKRLLFVEDAGHNDVFLFAGDDYQQAIRTFPASVLER